MRVFDWIDRRGKENGRRRKVDSTMGGTRDGGRVNAMESAGRFFLTLRIAKSSVGSGGPVVVVVAAVVRMYYLSVTSMIFLTHAEENRD